VSKWRRRLRWLPWIALGTAGAVVVVYLVMLGLMWHWVAKPPVLTTEPAITKLTREVRGTRVYLGRNWLDQRDGLPVLYLTGTPFELGYANAALTGPMIQRQEEAVLDMLQKVAPRRWTQFLLKFIVTCKNRHLQKHFPAAYQMEILGMTRGCPDPYPEVGPAFHRMLNYHAAQDISYMLMNSPLLRGGCTGFAAWGAQTDGGRLLVGRNFDWEAAPVFDEDRMVVICEPDVGIPFISLAWAGMAGCLSAMNLEGLAIFVNGAPSALPGSAGTPTCIVARDVAQHARTIAEATEIIGRHRIFVSAMFLVASRHDGRAVVIEKTPDQMIVREPVDEPWIICANHYMTATLTNTPVNLDYVRADTSLTRYKRMEELLISNSASLDPARTAYLLRDRLLPGGRAAGYGHRATLNPLIATHSVVIDLTEGIFWAALPPHQLGRYTPFDMKAPDQPLPSLTIAEDTLLINGGYKLHLDAKASLDAGWLALKQGNATRALELALQAEAHNPGFYRNAWLRAESLVALGRNQEAITACDLALAGEPALASEQTKIQKLRQEAGGVP
jgi:isopenicillin-N N-acyltransferase like protein